MRSWALLGGVGVLAWLQPFGCTVDAGAVIDPETAAVLAQVGPGVVEPALARFADAVDALGLAVGGWRSAVAAGGDASAARADAQAAWREAMDVWQELEVLQVGPAGSSLAVIGGQDLRDRIYSWPTVSRCRVDQETLGDAWSQDDFFVARNVNVIGLAALETLLFSPDGETGCTGDDVPGGWETLGDDAIAARRADYAAAVAAHLGDVTGDLVDAWAADGGDFAGTLAAAGEVGNVYATQGEGLNSVMDALFYLETRVKERKIARPLGLRDCAGLPCTAEVETPLAGGSDAWIRANLRGFRALFTGGDGDGLDDLLAARADDASRDEVLARLAAAEAAAAAITSPVDVAVVSDPAGMQALYDAVDALDYALKTEIAVELSLQVPEEAAGDND